MTATARRGMTLVEVSVALLIMAMGLALAAPVLRVDEAPGERFDTVVAGARSAAVRRSQHLLLTVDSASHWSLRASDGSIAGEGRVAGPYRSVRLRLTPMGACLLESAPAQFASGWDAVRCTTPAEAVVR